MTTDKLTAGLRALGEPKRLEILRKLIELEKNGEVTCSCLLNEIEVGQSTLSHHLSALVAAGLLRTENKGKYVMLHVEHEALKELGGLLGSLGDK